MKRKARGKNESNVNLQIQKRWDLSLQLHCNTEEVGVHNMGFVILDCFPYSVTLKGTQEKEKFRIEKQNKRKQEAKAKFVDLLL